MYEIDDGARILRFNGTKLAESSSYHSNSVRWIEFTLYRTTGGTYVLHRVGASLIYHSSVCPLVNKYGLHEEPGYELEDDAVPCPECKPGPSDPIVYPEEFRHWTLTTADPTAVIEALYRYDEFNARYLTRVAEVLIRKAAEHDSDLDDAYRIEYIQ